MLVSKLHQTSFHGSKMVEHIHYRYAFITEFCKFEEEF